MANAKPKFTAVAFTKRDGKDDWADTIGAAWETKSGDGLVVELRTLPKDGRFTLLPYKERPPRED